MGAGNQWLKPVLAKGVAMLILLRLKNAPTEDVIKPTLEAWYRTITYKRRYEQHLDQPRFEAAFMLWAQNNEWFPTPKELLATLPRPESPELPPPPPKSAVEREKEKVRQKAHIARLREIVMGVKINE